MSNVHDETYDELYQVSSNPVKKHKVGKALDENKRPFSPPIKQHLRGEGSIESRNHNEAIKSTVSF